MNPTDEVLAISSQELRDLAEKVHAGHEPEPWHCCSRETCRMIQKMIYDSPLYESGARDDD